jgi:hypothetical protein
MTILTSLLIATQGLLPSPTPLSIGTQGLLQTPGGPPPPPPEVRPDLSGGFYRGRDKVTVEIKRGVSARLQAGEPRVVVSSCVSTGSVCSEISLSSPSLHSGAHVQVDGVTQYFSANKPSVSVSTEFEIVGVQQENELELYIMAQAALEFFQNNRD